MQLANPFEVNDIEKYVGENASIQPDRKETKFVVVHHADAFYSPGTACASIFRAHSTRADFNDYRRIGYHDVLQIERNGTIALHHVNPPLMQAAGVAKMNHLCYHICAATKFTAIPEDIWIEAIAQACVLALVRWPDAKIVGHHDVTVPGHGTACPGQLWNAWKLRLLGRISAIRARADKPVRRFRVLGPPIFQAQSLTGTLAGHLQSGEVVEVDATYSNGGAHLKDQRGFIDLDLNALEEIS